ncbi:MAG: hypothetical protein HOW73_18140 [Polyangiaceae bacterium]|nr:hypothetical protein [Polyangiaceae bacterium]
MAEVGLCSWFALLIVKPDWIDFAPRLASDNCELTSNATEDYNCLAFAAGVTNQWWEPYVIPPSRPGIYWPAGVFPDNGVEHWVAALATVGFRPCTDASLDEAYVKVAVYGCDGDATHAARQLKDGRWASKLGLLEDIIHATAQDVAGGDYGEVAVVLARPRTEDDP